MQKTICYSCGSLTDTDSSICTECGMLLFKPKDEIEKLKNELSLFKQSIDIKLSSFSKQLCEYEHKMTMLNSHLAGYGSTEKAKIDESADKHKTDSQTEKVTDQADIPSEKGTSAPPKSYHNQQLTETNTANVLSSNPIDEQHKHPETKQEINPPAPKINKPVFAIERHKKEIRHTQKQSAVKPKTTKPAQASFFEKLKKNEAFMTVLEEAFSPILQLLKFTKGMYKKSKEKKQLPVFFMTLAGILAMLFGFGYLMQLSTSYLGEYSQFAKIVIGFAASFAVLFWGVRTEKKGEQFHGFASALIGLSVALNYLLIYFLSQVPWASSALLGFFLIISNTVLAKFMAIRYETRTVALISLAGGAFAPFYLSSDSSSPLYFFYLWLLSGSGIYLSKRLKWESLAVISFAVSSIVIELSVFAFDIGWSLTIDSILFHAFAYLFIVYAIIDGKKVAKSITSRQAGLIAGSIALLIVNLTQLYFSAESLETLGYIFLGNSFLSIVALTVLFKQLSPKVKLLFFIVAGSFAGFAVPALFDAQFMGIAWLAEAMLITYLGFSFNLPSVRTESLVLWLVAMVKIAATAKGFYFIDGESLISYAFINFAALWAGLIFMWVISHYFGKHLSRFEKTIIGILKNLCVLLTYFLIGAASFYRPSEISIIICLATVFPLIYISHKEKLSASISFSYLVFFGLIIFTLKESFSFYFNQWNRGLLNSGTYGFISSSVFLTSFYFWHHAIFKSPRDKATNRSQIKLIAEIASSTTVLFISLICFYWSHEFAVFPSAILLLASEHIARRAKVKISVSLHQVYFHLLFGYATIASISTFWATGKEVAFYANTIALPLIWLSKNKNLAYIASNTKLGLKRALKYSESAFIYALGYSFYFIMYALTEEYFASAVPLGMLAYLLYYKKRRIPAAEIGFYLQYLFLITMFVYTGIDNQSFRFGLLPLEGKIYFIEVAALLWGIKLMYQKTGVQNKKGSSVSNWLREIFYGIIPFSFLSPINRLYPEFLACGLWASSFVAFIMNKYLKRNYLLIELYIAAAIASIFSLFGNQHILSPIVGFAVATVVCLLDIRKHDKTFTSVQIKKQAAAWFYYFGVACGIVVYSFTQNMSLSAVSCALFLCIPSIAIQQLNVKFGIHKDALRYTSYGSATVAGMYMLKQGFTVASISLFAVCLALYFAELFKLRPAAKQKTAQLRINFDAIFINLILIICYAIISNKAVFSTLLIVHAIALLFTSIIPRYKNLIWLSIGVFGGALIKLIAYDLKNLSMGEKVFVLIGSGVILLAASFLYVKLREKMQPHQTEAVTEPEESSHER